MKAPSVVVLKKNEVIIDGVAHEYPGRIIAHIAARKAAHERGLKQFEEHLETGHVLRWAVQDGRSDFQDVH